jgi:DNA-binding CsgD family transcriptional regulator
MQLATNLSPSSRQPSPTWTDFLVGMADASWVVRQISLDEHGLLGEPTTDLVGTSLLDRVHPGDVADLRSGAAAALSDLSATSVCVNVGTRGHWHRARIVITPMLHHDLEIGFAIHRVSQGDPAERTMQLEQHLWRIARELEAAHVTVGTADAAPDIDGILGQDTLSPRQWEILRRLLQGERVPGISRSLYLSASTVRNHLTAIFAKFGVHSQEELIQLLRARSGATPMSA